MRCGSATRYLQPAGDNRERATCLACGHVHYENPNNVVGTVPVWQDKVLLCRRAIEPRHGKWTLPAGFMELAETTAEGALRETIEEAGIEVVMQPLFAVMNVKRVGQVHLFYRAQMTRAEWQPGEETLEAALFTQAELPWSELAFPTVKTCLELFFADRAQGSFGFHEIDIG
jgi:ADP-ribose pyrophosphatase YjhB (NUDIX family)